MIYEQPTRTEWVAGLRDRDPSLVDAAEIAKALAVDPASGLSSAEAARRLAAGWAE